MRDEVNSCVRKRIMQGAGLHRGRTSANHGGLPVVVLWQVDVGVELVALLQGQQAQAAELLELVGVRLNGAALVVVFNRAPLQSGVGVSGQVGNEG